MIEIRRNDNTIYNFTIEYNTISSAIDINIFNMKIISKNFESTFIITYAEPSDTLYIKFYSNTNNAIKFTNQLIFMNFEEDYGISFLEKFKQYLSNPEKLNNEFSYKNFYFVDKNFTSEFIFGKCNPLSTITINLKLKDKNGNKFTNFGKRIEVLIKSLEKFIDEYKLILEKRNDKEEKIEIKDNIEEKIFDIIDGKIIISKNEVIISHNYCNNEYCRINIPFSNIDFNELNRQLLYNDMDYSTIYTIYNDNFVVKFEDYDKTKEFLKYMINLLKV